MKKFALFVTLFVSLLFLGSCDDIYNKIKEENIVVVDQNNDIWHGTLKNHDQENNYIVLKGATSYCPCDHKRSHLAFYEKTETTIHNPKIVRYMNDANEIREKKEKEHKKRVNNVEINIRPFKSYLEKGTGKDRFANFYSVDEIEKMKKEGWEERQVTERRLLVLIKNTNPDVRVKSISFTIRVSRKGKNENLNIASYDNNLWSREYEIKSQEAFLWEWNDLITPQWLLDNKEEITYTAQSVYIVFDGNDLYIDENKS